MTDRLTVDSVNERLRPYDPGAVGTLEHALSMIDPQHRDDVRAAMDAAARTGAVVQTRFQATLGPGEDPLWMEIRARGRCDEHGAIVAVQGTNQDVTEQMKLVEDTRVRAKLLDAVGASVIATDLLGRVTHWNAGAERLYGHSVADAVGRLVSEVVLSVQGGEERASEIIDSVGRTGTWEGELQARRSDGTTIPIFARATTIEDQNGAPAGIISVSVDISARVEAERRLLAARDHLHAVTASMGDGLCTVDRSGRVAYVNPAGAELLGWADGELVGRRMHETTHFRRADGSAFPAADCPMVHARTSGKTVRAHEDVFIRKDGSELPVAWTSAPIDMEDGEQGAVVVFRDISERKREQERIERDAEALAWLARIRTALREDHFTLHAQPIIDVATSEVVQHELLIRMVGDDGAVIPPGRFLPVAEEYGLVRDIDRWVIRRAAQLAGQGHAIELNLSAESLSSPELYDLVVREIDEAGADPSLIVIELTETAVVTNEEVAAAFLERVAELGCRVALDDFGTGYGGFTYVKRLPVDYLKIDIEFVRDLSSSEASRHVVRAIVQLARDFGKSTVAEGVEDEETLDTLRELGVDLAQGYHIARPAPADEVLGAADPASVTDA